LESRVVAVENEEKRRLKSVVAHISIEIECRVRKIASLENSRLWHSIKAKPGVHRFAFQVWCGVTSVWNLLRAAQQREAPPLQPNKHGPKVHADDHGIRQFLNKSS
jgi:hypothetical protein